MENYRDHAKSLCQPALELIEHILIKHDSTIIEEMHSLVKENKRLRDQLSASFVPDGWKIVPVKEDVEMRSAGFSCCDVTALKVTEIWAAMVSAAPEPPKE